MIAWLAAAALATCPSTGSADDAFARRPIADRVLVVLELWATGAPAGWAEAALDVADARGLPVMVVVPLAPPGAELEPVLRRVAEGPHELMVVLPEALVPRDPRASSRALRSAVRAVEQASEPVKTVLAPLGTRVTEALLGQAGFRSLVDAGAVSTPTPRMAGHFEGMQRIDVVLPPGPYDDACGADPRSAPFLPSAGDRAATAIDLANVVVGTPVVRVALDGSGAGPRDAEVLGRWLDEVLLPSGAKVVTAEQARARVLEGFRRPGSVDGPSALGGRLVAVDELRAAAARLATGEVLPRTLPGELSLTELFAGLVLLESGHVEGSVVRLRGLAGPATLARSALTGPTEVDRAALTALAAQLAAGWPTEVPSALPVGGQLLTASELLVALASAATGADPALTRPVAVPDPNDRGLGWGSSTVP